MANPYFNAAYYLANNSDLVLAGITEATAEQHFNEYGAGEGRPANSWFDADFYLLSNPDLIAAGLTRANALSHFAEFGVTEGRTFSANPALDPAEFDAEDYAERYPDVAEALGIDPEEEMTDVQAGQLMGHFLAYGIREGRTAEPASFNTAANGDMIPVLGSEVVLGTSANDVFLWNSAVAGTTLTPAVNGLGGTDEIVFRNLSGDVDLTTAQLENITIEGLGAASTLDVEGKGVQNVAVDTNDLATTSTGVFTFGYTGNLVESFEVEGAGVVTAAFGKSANGAADALELTLDLDGTFAVTNTYDTKGADSGIENLTLNIVEDGDNTGATVDLGAVNGEEVSVAINSEAAEITVNINGSIAADNEDYSTITVDASGANGVRINVDADFASSVELDVIQIGSDGRDFLTGNVSIDTLSGNAGNDSFIFTTAAATAARIEDGELAAVDTITDFEDGDVISFTGAAAATAIDAEIGALESGVVSFAFGFTTGKSLEDILLELAEDTSINGQLLFQFGADAYVYSSADADTDGALDAAQLIKLAGVTASDLEIGAGVIQFASA